MNALRIAFLCSVLAAPAHAGRNSAGAAPQDAAPAARPQPPVALPPCGAASPQEGVVQFCFTAEPGGTTLSRVVTKTFGSMNMFGSMFAQKFSQQFEQEIFMKCIEVRPDKSIIYEMSLPNVAMKMNLGGIRLDIDTRRQDGAASTQPVFQMLHRMFKSMTRIKCRVTVSPEGEPLKVEGLSEGMNSALDELSDQLMPGMKQFFDQFRDQLGNNIMDEQMRSTSRMIPDGGQARIGDVWVREWQINLPPFNVATQGRGEYQLLGVEEFRGRPCAKIRVKTTMSTLADQKPDAAKLGSVPKGLFERMRFSMDLSGGNGVAYLDYTTGDLVQLRETQRITLEMSVDPDPGAGDEELRGGLGKITQKLTTSVQMDLLEKNGRPVTENETARASGLVSPASRR